MPLLLFLLSLSESLFPVMVLDHWRCRCCCQWCRCRCWATIRVRWCRWWLIEIIWLVLDHRWCLCCCRLCRCRAIGDVLSFLSFDVDIRYMWKARWQPAEYHSSFPTSREIYPCTPCVACQPSGFVRVQECSPFYGKVRWMLAHKTSEGIKRHKNCYVLLVPIFFKNLVFSTPRPKQICMCSSKFPFLRVPF